jgi:acetylornithine deacetylase
MDPVIALLSDLVAIDSVNPSLVSGARGEAEIAAFLAEVLRQAGLTVTIQEAVPGRPNVVGVLEGRRPGPALMFCGHTDTVGVAGMEHPFTPEIRGDRLYGRGSQDMKSGVAAMVDAARTLARDGGLSAGRLIVAAVIDEEHGSAGADALVREWRADAAVITEPTGLDIGIAHKGFQWVTVQTRGRAAHGSRPAEGRDAIMRMGRVLVALESLGRDLERGRTHPLLGAASLHASIVSGGTELSTYPASCSLQFERRTLPGEPDDVALREAERVIARLREEDAEFEAAAEGRFGRGAYELPDNHPLASTLRAAATHVRVAAQQTGLSFWTDAAILGAAGIPAVLFGPGGAGLHSTEEYVLIPDVCACRDTLVTLGRRFTGDDERDAA